MNIRNEIVKEQVNRDLDANNKIIYEQVRQLHNLISNYMIPHHMPIRTLDITYEVVSETFKKEATLYNKYEGR